MRFLPLALLFAACGSGVPTSGVVRSTGVAEAVFETRANHTDVVTTHVFFPADAAGRPVGQRHPGLVFVQCGAVPVSRYAWLGEALARAGIVVAMPEHPLDLAFFAVDDGLAARRVLVTSEGGPLLDALVEPSKVAVAGHSLGGVVAAKLVLEGGFAALVLDASFPDSADETALEALTLPTLSLAGSLDCSAKLEKVSDGATHLPRPRVLAVMPGVTHYQFTDSQREDDAKGCTPGVSLEAAHETIASAMRTFVSTATGPAPDSVAAGLRKLGGLEVSTP
jgi:predicted dienelactone hydrolase